MLQRLHPNCDAGVRSSGTAWNCGSVAPAGSVRAESGLTPPGPVHMSDADLGCTAFFFSSSFHPFFEMCRRFSLETTHGKTHSENGEGECWWSRIASPYPDANNVAPPATNDEEEYRTRSLSRCNRPLTTTIHFLNRHRARNDDTRLLRLLGGGGTPAAHRV